MTTPMPPLEAGGERAPRTRRRRRHWVAAVVGLLPSLPLLAWLAAVALSAAVDPTGGVSQSQSRGAVGQVLGWTVVILPITVALGLPLVAVVYLLAHFWTSWTGRAGVRRWHDDRHG